MEKAHSSETSLRCHADVKVGDVFAIKQNLTRRNRLMPRNHPQCCAFATTTGTEKAAVLLGASTAIGVANGALAAFNLIPGR
nr:hypothetical protein [Veronia pacifica]